jgi:IS30 family transposase
MIRIIEFCTILYSLFAVFLLHNTSLRHGRIYQHILGDKRSAGDLYTHLCRQDKKYQKQCYSKRSRGTIMHRVGIEARSQVVEDQETN